MGVPSTSSCKSREAFIVSDRVTRGKLISLIAGLPLAVAAMTAIASADDDSNGTKAQC
jgi:hypothetical protein